eukprot:3497848-Amphidinium_carterae.1
MSAASAVAGTCIAWTQGDVRLLQRMLEIVAVKWQLRFTTLPQRPIPRHLCTYMCSGFDSVTIAVTDFHFSLNDSQEKVLICRLVVAVTVDTFHCLGFERQQFRTSCLN